MPKAQTKMNSNIDLRHGDCRSVLKKLNENSVHMVLTDPPYFIDGLDDSWRKGKEGVKKGTGAVGGLPVGMKFDPAQGRALQSFMHDIAAELARVLVPGGFMLSFSQPRLAHRMACGIEDAGFEIRDLYAWHYTKRAQMKAFSQLHFVEKMDTLTQAQRLEIKLELQGRKTPQLRPQFESIIMAQNPRCGTFVENWMAHKVGLIDVRKTLDGTTPSTVMKVEKPTGDERYHGHMTPKPVALLSHLIELFTLPKQKILDPFLGSGSTALAAAHTGRSCIGIEVVGDYLEIAKHRLERTNDGN